jgi:hypothetical protein
VFICSKVIYLFWLIRKKMTEKGRNRLDQLYDFVSECRDLVVNPLVERYEKIQAALAQDDDEVLREHRQAKLDASETSALNRDFSFAGGKKSPAFEKIPQSESPQLPDQPRYVTNHANSDKIPSKGTRSGGTIQSSVKTEVVVSAHVSHSAVLA